MPFHRLPEISQCCYCITDLKTAAAIIAVLGIITSPAFSWAVVRHSYVIRVSCFVTTADSRADVVDINLNNIVSFGFGAHAGLGPSCLGPVKAESKKDFVFRARERTDPQSSPFVTTTKYIGWGVLLVDVIFMFCSINFLVKIFQEEPTQTIRAAKIFQWVATLSVFFSFVYGMLYVIACVIIGGAFPIFELVFGFVDIALWVIWVYLIYVIWCFMMKLERQLQPPPSIICEKISSTLLSVAHSIASTASYIYGNLKIACILIDVCRILTACGVIHFLVYPSCEGQFNKGASDVSGILNIFRLLVFIFQCIYLASCFVYMFGLFLVIQVTADIIMTCGILSCLISIIYAIILIVQMVKIECSDPSAVFFIIFFDFIPFCICYKNHGHEKTGADVDVRLLMVTVLFNLIYIRYQKIPTIGPSYKMDKLPQVENCCFVVPLKIGTIIVAVLSILISGGLCGMAASIGGDCYGTGILLTIASSLSYVLYVVNLIVIIASIAFLIGIFLEKGITAKIYVYAGLAYVLLFTICSVLIIVSKFIGCPKLPIPEIVSTAITVIFWLYFVVVAKSYATSEMGED